MITFGKKEIKRMYGLTDARFRVWVKDYIEDFGINKTKQTFTPKQLALIVKELGFPPYCEEKEIPVLQHICHVTAI